MVLDEERLEVKLALWERILGLMGSIRVARREIHDVRVVEEPIPEAMTAWPKVGLRLPWFYYVARTLGLDEAFAVKRGVPALSFAINGAGRLRRVLASTPQAQDFARALNAE